MIYSAHAVRSAALATERVERRLAAILTADVAGYSRLMGADEEGTLARLKAHRRELIDPKISEHRGRIVKTTGDGLLVEFTSVVDALRCATEIQRGMAEGNSVVPADGQIEFRIGIHQLSNTSSPSGSGSGYSRASSGFPHSMICIARMLASSIPRGKLLN